LEMNIAMTNTSFSTSNTSGRTKTTSNISIVSVVLVLGLTVVQVSCFNIGIITQSKRSQLKSEILQLSTETKRGLVATDEQKDRMYSFFQELEKYNPTPKPLKSKLVNGDWNLEYTTSDSILGKGGFPRVGPIVQRIDTVSLKAENSETVAYFPFGLINVPRKVSAKLDPQSDQLTNVQFERFSIGPVGFDAPDSFKGSLDVTYLDEDLRLTRGDKGNIFVLTRM